MATPLPKLRNITSHDAIAVAIQEDKDLRMRVCESSEPAVFSPRPSRVGLQVDTDTPSFSVVPQVVDKEGDEPAQHTDMVIVEDT